MTDTIDGGPPSRASVHARLTEQAQLFEDPAAYLAGVEDALAAIESAEGVGVTQAGITVYLDESPTSRTERARYLAALAVGLVTAGRASREVTEELVEAAEANASLLQQAARNVYALRVGDAEARRSAETLLHQAVVSCRPVRPVPSPTEQARPA